MKGPANSAAYTPSNSTFGLKIEVPITITLQAKNATMVKSLNEIAPSCPEWEHPIDRSNAPERRGLIAQKRRYVPPIFKRNAHAFISIL
jgi:hypothetical protein